MSIKDYPQIVRDTKPLSEGSLAEELQGRESLQVDVLRFVSPVIERKSSANIWIHGSPGTGKTSVVRRTLNHLEEKGVTTVLINCWSNQTFYSVLDQVFGQLRTLVPEMRDVSFKYERLARIARDKPLMIGLDEVDQMFLKERNATLYNLAQLNHSGLICISNSRESYLALDPRVRSRLNPVFLDFSPYPTEDLVQILEHRATRSLDPKAWCQADLDHIAGASDGDARVAIQTLRTAAYLAEKKKIPQIRQADIEQGLRDTSQLRRNYLLKTLSEHHRLIYELVRETPKIKMDRLWRVYLKAARSKGLDPMARRTVNHYRQYMVDQRLIKETQARGRRNARILEVIG